MQLLLLLVLCFSGILSLLLVNRQPLDCGDSDESGQRDSVQWKKIQGISASFSFHYLWSSCFCSCFKVLGSAGLTDTELVSLVLFLCFSVFLPYLPLGFFRGSVLCLCLSFSLCSFQDLTQPAIMEKKNRYLKKKKKKDLADLGFCEESVSLQPRPVSRVPIQRCRGHSYKHLLPAFHARAMSSPASRCHRQSKSVAKFSCF